MIEILAATLCTLAGLATGYALTYREVGHAHDALVAERGRVADLTKLLMAKSAPAEFSAYVAPLPSVPAFPADAVWDESGLYYVIPEAD